MGSSSSLSPLFSRRLLPFIASSIFRLLTLLALAVDFRCVFGATWCSLVIRPRLACQPALHLQRVSSACSPNLQGIWVSDRATLNSTDSGERGSAIRGWQMPVISTSQTSQAKADEETMGKGEDGDDNIKEDISVCSMCREK